jgi:suppressor of fused
LSDERGPIAALIDDLDGGPPAHVLTLAKPGSVAAVSVYALEQPPHWHLVTEGLSGAGFELTFRLARGDDVRPDWAVNLLANLAAYLISGDHPFAAGHHIDLRGPIRLGDPTAITAAAVVVDPGLGIVEGPDGPVEFLQVVGLTADELEACRAWRTEAVIDLLAAADSLLVTRLPRPSLLDDPAVRERVEAGVAAEGSALVELRVATLRWSTKGRRHRRLVVTMGAGAAAALGPALRRKLTAGGASFDLIGDPGRVRFVVADQPRWDIEPGMVTVAVPPDEVDALAGMFTGRTGRGRVAAVPDLAVVVVP